MFIEIAIPVIVGVALLGSLYALLYVSYRHSGEVEVREENGSRALKDEESGCG
jgi:hypothetical protein